MTNRHKLPGFTLIETLIAVALLAIITVWAMPHLRQFLVRNSFEGAVLDLRGAISRARAEAIARGTVVTFGPQTAGDWTSGFQTFVDPLQKGTFVAADSIGTGTDQRKAEKLQVATTPSGLSLTWPAKSSSGTADSAPYFSFSADGRPVLTSGLSGNASLPVCVPSEFLATNNCREIVVDVIGRIRVNPYTKAI